VFAALLATHLWHATIFGKGQTCGMDPGCVVTPIVDSTTLWESVTANDVEGAKRSWAELLAIVGQGLTLCRDLINSLQENPQRTQRLLGLILDLDPVHIGQEESSRILRHVFFLPVAEAIDEICQQPPVKEITDHLNNLRSRRRAVVAHQKQLREEACCSYLNTIFDCMNKSGLFKCKRQRWFLQPKTAPLLFFRDEEQGIPGPLTAPSKIREYLLACDSELLALGKTRYLTESKIETIINRVNDQRVQEEPRPSTTTDDHGGARRKRSAIRRPNSALAGANSSRPGKKKKTCGNNAQETSADRLPVSTADEIDLDPDKPMAAAKEKTPKQMQELAGVQDPQREPPVSTKTRFLAASDLWLHCPQDIGMLNSEDPTAVVQQFHNNILVSAMSVALPEVSSLLNKIALPFDLLFVSGKKLWEFLGLPPRPRNREQS
jgi:hypothetical protein